MKYINFIRIVHNKKNRNKVFILVTILFVIGGTVPTVKSIFPSVNMNESEAYAEMTLDGHHSQDKHCYHHEHYVPSENISPEGCSLEIFSSVVKKEAVDTCNHLKKLGYKPILTHQPGIEEMYILYSRIFTNQADAKNCMAILKSKGYESNYIPLEDTRCTVRIAVCAYKAGINETLMDLEKFITTLRIVKETIQTHRYIVLIDTIRSEQELRKIIAELRIYGYNACIVSNDCHSPQPLSSASSELPSAASLPEQKPTLMSYSMQSLIPNKQTLPEQSGSLTNTLPIHNAEPRKPPIAKSNDQPKSTSDKSSTISSLAETPPIEKAREKLPSLSSRPSQRITAKDYNNLGVSCYYKGDLNEALKYYKKAIQMDPDYFESYVNIGIVYKKQDKLKDALTSYKKALALNPDSPELYYNIGILYDHAAYYKNAEKAYEKFLTLMPKKYHNLREKVRERLSMIQYYSN
ncbi:MAG: tetratricopeptide repeat protein [bacterium]